MQTLFRISLLLILFLNFSPLYANPSSVDLTQLLSHVTSMQADFTQVVTDPKGKNLNQTQGHMALLRPGKFRWDTTLPNKQLIVTNGKKIWIYDPDLEQVTIRYLTKEAGETPALLLSNTNAALDKDFNVQVTTGNSSLEWYLLKPTDKSSMFESIKLGFANHQIKQMQLQDHLGHITDIKFSRVVLNQKLSSALFNFHPPANIDVIDETRK